MDSKKEELSIDDIAALGATRKSFAGIPGAPHAHGKSGLATKNPDGAQAEKARGEALTEAAADGRVIVQPKANVDAVMRAINEGFDGKFIHDKFLEVLGASKTIVSKDGSVTIAPDHPTQVRALELLLKYRVGLPVQRTEVVTPTTDASANLRAKLAASPALRRAFRESLDRLDETDKALDVASVLTEDELPDPPLRRAPNRGDAGKYEGLG